jgi:hypothetical protein
MVFKEGNVCVPSVLPRGGAGGKKLTSGGIFSSMDINVFVFEPRIHTD